ncbi:oxygen-insensitive NADPH nitroreductase [Vibrio palustris]|uniref:NADPH-flavin oxidoreductase n=1 Tax=Vibrio palustris TaxID=1918946 RepID=A0A1R4B8D2_9VIBR|nr:oxygen-insensitive NADPH nitroreductase [Vibrio palustris]SJL85187.1 NADPH-flavin oxidoreductase [Vibrio palustris]
MNSVVNTIQAHRSIRAFTEQPISKEQLDSIIESGLAASTSSLLQTVSIVRVTDPAKRKALAELAGPQPWIEAAAEFLVFFIDYQRHHEISDQVKSEYTELTLIGAVDAGIMAQNCLLAAESMGLGGVYIGGLRNDPARVDDILGLPENSATLFGMCLGHPAQDPQKKPRLPASVIVHEDQYQPLDHQAIADYDQVMLDYYATRSGNTKQQGWSEQITNTLSKESRPYMQSYLHSKGLNKK